MCIRDDKLIYVHKKALPKIVVEFTREMTIISNPNTICAFKRRSEDDDARQLLEI